METLTLEDQQNGELVDFDMIVEEDLAWLDGATELGAKLRRSIVDCHMDDDVLTDDE